MQINAGKFQMDSKLFFQKCLGQAEYRSCLWLVGIGAGIFLGAAIDAYGKINLTHYCVTFLLTPLGVSVLQYSRRKRIAQTNPKWKEEFLVALVFFILAIFVIYRQIWLEYQIFSVTYSNLMLICFLWSDALFKLLGLRGDK